MPPRNSNQDTDGTVWATAGVRLGEYGMDLRRPSEPPALADLLNARFINERTLNRRNGFDGQELRDGESFPVTTSGLDPLSGGWVYGHGQWVTDNAEHYPIHLRGGATFNLGDEQVAWTGDRLLLPQSDGTSAIGSSDFWGRTSNNGPVHPRGIPAHLPLETDTYPPNTVHGDWVEGCATESLRVYVHIVSNAVVATVVDRASGAVLSTTTVTGTSTAPCCPTVLESGGTVVLLFGDTTDHYLRFRYLTGTTWSNEDHLATDAVSYDVAALPGTGFFVMWYTGSGLKIGIVAGQGTSELIPFGTTLTTSSPVTGPVIALGFCALGIALGVAYQSGTSLVFDEFNTLLTQVATFTPRTSWTPQGLTVSARALVYNGTIAPAEWVVHSGDTGGDVQVVSYNSTFGATTTFHRYNSDLISRSFTVGDEVFAWMRSRNSDSLYLLCGATHPYVSGSADRESGVTPKVPGGSYIYWPQRVLVDPLVPAAVNTTLSTGTSTFDLPSVSPLSTQITQYTRWTWTRQYSTGDASRTGDALTGDLDFLPRLSVAVYGRSAYLSGSRVKNWDGAALLDAGWDDYPVVSGYAEATGGSLTVGGTYEWLCRAVRYNAQGERFESPTLVTPSRTLAGSNTKVTLTINPPPATSADDFTIEVYRTESLGTAFYLEGVISGPFNGAATTTFVSTMADDTLITEKGDPHRAGLGQDSTLEDFAPIGCAFLRTIGDRLWGGGGQLPRGQVQFSKLKDIGFGAGFDDLAGYIQVDNEGGAVTSIADLNDAKVVFEADRIFAFGGEGPNNYGIGEFSTPQLKLAAGAVTDVGTTLCQLGVLYWSAGGPLLLTQGFQVENISSPVRPMTELLTPTGVQVDTARMEVVWYCGRVAVLLNYMSGSPRWARWSTPDVAGASADRVITVDGRLLTENVDAAGDDTVPFSFMWRSGNIHPESLLQGFTLINRVGVLGEYQGPHQLRMRLFYDAAPLWIEESVWNALAGTWLTSGDDLSSLTPGAIDASLGGTDHSGGYATHKKVRRQNCHYVSVEVSDLSAQGPTYTPFELSVELGAKPGLGRTPAATFTGQDR